MSRASRYEREFASLLAAHGPVGRFAASGALRSIVGDLVFFPARGTLSEPVIVEVKSTKKSVYYPSESVHLLHHLSRDYLFRPVLAVRFAGVGWAVFDVSEDVPQKVTMDDVRIPLTRSASLSDLLGRMV